MVTNGPIMVPESEGSKWSLTARNGPKMGRNGQKWAEMGRNGPNRSEMVQKGQKGTKTGRKQRI